MNENEREAFWRNRKVLVTGATGLLGSWLTDKLLQLKSDVVILQRDHVPHSLFLSKKMFEKATVVYGDLRHAKTLNRTINEYEIDTVFHLAAQTQVLVANRNPIPTFDSNIRGTWNLLEACRQNSIVKQILIASSDKAYGDQTKLPYTEDTALEGRNPYDVSKSCADLIAQSYFHTYKLPVLITRCVNFYGGGDLNFNRLIPGTIRSIFYGEPPVIRSNGKFLRDYLYIEDAVEAYLKAAEVMLEKNLHGKALNIGTQSKIDVLALVETILSLMKSSLKPKILDEVQNEIKDQYLDSQKAMKVLNWRPKHDLRSGLQETISWYLKFLKEQAS